MSVWFFHSIFLPKTPTTLNLVSLTNLAGANWDLVETIAVVGVVIALLFQCIVLFYDKTRTHKDTKIRLPSCVKLLIAHWWLKCYIHVSFKHEKGAIKRLLSYLTESWSNDNWSSYFPGDRLCTRSQSIQTISRSGIRFTSVKNGHLYLSSGVAKSGLGYYE